MEKMSRQGELTEIADHYGTDKGSRCHLYTKWYEQWSHGIRQNVHRVLEIGVSDGWSLRMWRDWFPKATIIGIDNNQSCDHCNHEERIQVYIGDQKDHDFVTSIASKFGPFNLIVDDGEHYCNALIQSFESLWPYVQHGGLYAIEDIHISYWQDRKAANYFKQLVDTINLNGRSGYGDISKDPNPVTTEPLEQAIESIQFFKSLIFVRFR